jgi:hypothetical protein
MIGAAVVYVAGVVAQVAFLPKRNSRHFALSIFNSMGRRHADYERDGDKQRAEAMRYLLDRFVVEYGAAITKGEKNP